MEIYTYPTQWQWLYEPFFLNSFDNCRGFCCHMRNSTKATSTTSTRMTHGGGREQSDLFPPPV
jgi:hypothetical protein